MRSIDGRTLYQRAVAVDVSERGGSVPTSIPSKGFAFPVLCTNAGAGRPGVLHVVEHATVLADEIKIACETTKMCDGTVYGSWTAGERTIAVQVSERGGYVIADVDGVDPGFALPVLCTNTGAVEAIPVFSCR